MNLPRFGVTRPVPVNLLMVAFLVAGAVAAGSITKEFFPETSPESAVISLTYPGATPSEIEETLARKVEDKVADLDEVEQITATLVEGGGTIVVEYRDGIGDVLAATDEVERAIDTLTDLPAEAERIQVSIFEPRLPVIMINLYGPASEDARKRALRQMRDELQGLPGMGEMVVAGVRDYEIRVDVNVSALLEYGLSLPEVAATIRSWMSDEPGGTVRTGVGNINIRTMGVEERASAIRDIVLRATTDGQMLRVKDVATVRETFVDQQIKTRFSTPEGRGPSASLTVYKVGDQDAVKIAEMVRSYVRGRQMAADHAEARFEPKLLDRIFAVLNRMSAPAIAEGKMKRLRTNRFVAYELGFGSASPLPTGCRLATSSDLARFIEGRLDLLTRNAKYGALLVFATLLLVLNWRTAFWVGVGLATALAGTLFFMKMAGVTLNLLTMFGLIVVMGLLVDDAIVVAENITARHERSEPALEAAIVGTNQVLWPVVATVMTSIVAFLPLTFIKGQIGDLLGALPWVVACALVMSLVESILILPSHIGHSLVRRDRVRDIKRRSIFQRFEERRDRVIMDGLVPAYGRLLAVATRYRYLSLAIALATLVATMGIVAGGRLQFTFIPSSDSETIIAELRMPIGTSLVETEAVVARLEDAASRQPETLTTSTLIGVQAAVDDTSGVVNAGVGTHLGQLFVELQPVERRDRESGQVIAAIRADLGVIDGVESLSFSEIQGGPGGKDITIRVVGEREASLLVAVADVKALLADVEGVVDISDDNSQGQREVQITLRPGAAALGFSVSDVARQVRGALFGLEAHVFSADQEDIDVRVRLDEASRESLLAIEHLWIVAPDGGRVPLQEIASLSEGTSYNTIRRVDRRRAISVSADALPGLSPEEVVAGIQGDLSRLAASHGDVTIEFAGRQREFKRAFQSLPVGFGAAIILIYVILAWLFSSYVQPIAVMLAVPFSTIGVVWGHLLLGYDLTFLSLIGFVALSGIVVNDSLIYVQFFNERHDRGEPFMEAILEAGRQRLRPILLTTVTTVLGLTPLMLEQSFQAKFLIPMAISIAFGLMSATVLILLLLPCILVIVDDLKALGHRLWFGRPRPILGSPVLDLETD